LTNLTRGERRGKQLNQISYRKKCDDKYLHFFSTIFKHMKEQLFMHLETKNGEYLKVSCFWHLIFVLNILLLIMITIKEELK